MTEQFIFIKKIDLNNNCPICYTNNGLHLTFSQKVIENSFYKSVSSEIKYDIACNNCENIIYPVNWTDDIERVFEYHKKTFTIQDPQTHLKKASFLAIFSGIVIAIFISILVYSQL